MVFARKFTLGEKKIPVYCLILWNIFLGKSESVKHINFTVWTFLGRKLKAASEKTFKKNI